MESLQIPRARYVVFANHRRIDWLAALAPEVDDPLHHQKDAILFIGRCTQRNNARTHSATGLGERGRGLAGSIKGAHTAIAVVAFVLEVLHPQIEHGVAGGLVRHGQFWTG